MARRRRVMGLPIGRRRSRMKIAKRVGGAAALAAAPLAVPAARRVVGMTRGAGQMVDQGQELAGKASKVMATAGSVSDAVSSRSSTLGKVGGVVAALAKGGKSGGGASKPKLAHLIEQHTDIADPRSV